MTPRIVTRAALTAAASLAVVAPIAGCSGNDTSPSPSSPSDKPSASSRPTSTSSNSTDYRDGTYTVRGVYGGAPSYITVTITLQADTITAVKVGLMPNNNGTSRGYQEKFAAAVPDEVTGKSIDDLTVGKIAGASGCSDGFNDALAKIRAQASTSN
ncbi:MAG: hypothetical protein ACOYBY_17840 [Dermatophilaceae bacterium]